MAYTTTGVDLHEAGIPGATARTLVLASGRAGEGTSTIARNISIGLKTQGNEVCLLDTASSTGNPSGHSPPGLTEQLDNAAAPTFIGANVPVYSVGSELAGFVHQEIQYQLQLINTLQGLEGRFDYLVVDSSATGDNRRLPLLLAAPTMLLIITPEADSHTRAFSLLKSLKRHYFEQPLYVIVNKVTDLPAAHDSFRRFRRATMKYLQMEARYLGYLLTDDKMPRSVAPHLPPSPLHPKSMSYQCLASISRRILQLIPPGSDAEGLSSYLAKLLNESPPGEGLAIVTGRPNGQAVASSALPGQHQPEDLEGLRAASRYAALLGQEE